MFKLRLAAAAAIACGVTLLSSGVAQAYPACGVTLTLNHSTVVGGKSFTFTADAGDTECDWVVTYRGKTKTGSGTSISGSFSTPDVSKTTTSKIVAECTHELVEDSSASSSASADVTPAFYAAGTATAVQAAERTCPISATVTLLADGVANEDDGALPDTGGSNLWLLAVGGALVVGGAGVTYAARRRNSSH